MYKDIYYTSRILLK